MPTCFDLEVNLRGIEPRIWRRVLLASGSTFADLHHAIQDAGGWMDSHLYVFTDRQGVALAGLATEESEDPDANEVELASHFRKKGDRCVYYYDFGDSWELDVVSHGLVEVEERIVRRLIGGERSFPPEDCGGVSGYAECVEAVNARGRGLSEEMKGRKEWLGRWKPEGFDLERLRKDFDRPRRRKPSKAAQKAAEGRSAERARPEARRATAFSHTNRFGVTYYLHETIGKRGAVRYSFKRNVGTGAVPSLPEGYEVRESVNGVVSIASRQPERPVDEDAKVVSSFLERDLRLRVYRVEVKGDSIFVHEPTNLVGGPGDAPLPESLRAFLGSRAYYQPPLRYSPVLRFDLGEGEGKRRYVVRRMTYRGDGGWSWPIGSGDLAELVKRFLPALGTDNFFELM